MMSAPLPFLSESHRGLYVGRVDESQSVGYASWHAIFNPDGTLFAGPFRDERRAIELLHKLGNVIR